MAAVALSPSSLHEIESEFSPFDEDDFWFAFGDENDEPSDEELDAILAAEESDGDF